MSSITASVTRETKSRETSLPLMSARWLAMSPVVIPFA